MYIIPIRYREALKQCYDSASDSAKVRQIVADAIAPTAPITPEDMEWAHGRLALTNRGRIGLGMFVCDQDKDDDAALSAAAASLRALPRVVAALSLADKSLAVTIMTTAEGLAIKQEAMTAISAALRRLAGEGDGT